MAKKITKSINKDFIPTYINGIPVYGLGSWLKKKALPFIGDAGKLYADNMLSTVGASDLIKDDMYSNKAFKDISGVTSNIYSTAGQIGANVVAPGIGGVAMGGVQEGIGSVAGEQSKLMDEQEEILNTQQGKLNSMNRLNTLKPQVDYGAVMKDGGKMIYSGGGQLTDTGFMNVDNTTEYKNGGTHQSNPLGGIPLANEALVEEGEVRFDLGKGESYVFSNRLPYKKQ